MISNYIRLAKQDFGLKEQNRIILLLICTAFITYTAIEIQVRVGRSFWFLQVGIEGWGVPNL